MTTAAVAVSIALAGGWLTLRWREESSRLDHIVAAVLDKKFEQVDEQCR